MKRTLRLPVVALLVIGVSAGPAARADQSQPGSAKDGKLTPGRPAVPTFGGAGVPGCPRSGLNDLLPLEVGRAAKAAGRPAPEMSGALCAIADTFANWKEPAPPRDAVIAFVSEWFGLPVAARQVLVGTLPSDKEEAIAENLAGNIMGFAKRALNPRYGAVMVLLPRADRFAQRESRVVVVLEDHVLTIDPPFPRRLDLGQSAVLSGRLHGATDPRIAISEVGGQVVSPEQAPGDAFKANVSCGTRPGAIWVQVSGVHEGQRRVVASIEVACGKDLPSSVPLEPPKVAIEGPDQERQVLQRINAERGLSGLAPLAWDDAVAGVAKGISEKMSDPARAGTATAPEDIRAALEKAGAASSLLAVNPAQGVTIDQAQERLLSSPTHRANMLNAELTTAGVGATTVAGKDGTTATYLAEVFVKLVPKVDTSDIRAKLAALIAERRVDAKMPPLKTDPVLQSAAQKYADELAAAHGNLPEARDDEIIAQVKKAFKGTVTMLSGASTTPLEYAKQPKMIAAGPDALGVGVAQGDHPTLGRNTFFVVILRGTRR